MSTNGNTTKLKRKMLSNIDSLKEKIDKNNIVIFTFLDCLTLTNVLNKNDIIKLLDRRVKKEYKINGLYKERIKAEDKLEENKSIDKIYDILEHKLRLNTGKVQREEINIFSEFTTLNTFMLKAYNYALDSGKNIYIINNTMYKDEDIKEILKKLKLDKYLEIINYNKVNEFDNKATLYIIPSKDEYKIKDVVKTKLKLYLYQNPLDNEDIRINKKYKLEEGILKAIQYNRIYNQDEIKYFEKFGIEYISPIYYYFVNWLFEKTKDLDNLFFLSRDGYLPQKIYDKFKEKRKSDIYTKYLYASRKAYQIPGLILVDEEKAIKTVTEWNMQLDERITLREILTNCSIEINDEILSNIKAHNLGDIDKAINLSSVKNVQEFLKEIYPKIKEKLLERYELAKCYLLSEDLDKYNRINVMDIGWRGSVQNYLTKILNKDIYGYYFGTMITEYKDIRKKMQGCFSNKFMPISRSEFILDNIMMFEIIFSAPHPALSGFKKEDNKKVVPVFSNSDDGKSPDIIEMFQNSALDIIDEYLKLDEYLKDMDINTSLKYYKEFLNNRDYEDIIEFRNLKTNLGYGSKQKSYVFEVSQKEIINNTKQVLEKADFSFWKGAIYIEGINSKEEYNKFKEKNNLQLKRNKFFSNRIIRSVIITLKNNKK